MSYSSPPGIDLDSTYQGKVREEGGIIAVGIASILSAVTILGLLSYMAFLLISFKRAPPRRKGPGMAPPQERETQVRFLKTQFGFLFVNLLVADLVQCVGFIPMFRWVKLGYVERGAVCTVQALGIQTGDAASSLFNLAIAVHTASILGFRYKPSKFVLYSFAAFIWALVIVLSVLGPTTVVRDSRGPFYGRAGEWCFIDPEYSASWVWLHYVFVFLSAFGTIVMYSFVFFSLSQIWPFNGALPAFRSKSVVALGQPTRTSADGQRVKVRDLPSFPMLERTAKKMIGYPIIFTALVLPLSACRLASFSGHSIPPKVLCFAGFLMASCGFADVCLFLFSRGFIEFGKGHYSSGSRKPYELYTTSVRVHTVQTTVVDQVTPTTPRRPRYVEKSESISKAGESVTSIDLEMGSPQTPFEVVVDKKDSELDIDITTPSNVYYPAERFQERYHGLHSPTQ
ncbi:hypothetical protein BT69DRAFT_1347366 [Atractiella rhizophila]|nr:hypothetical protein BT69DRAFT_1347366 [Atractiella rhizophila]